MNQLDIELSMGAGYCAHSRRIAASNIAGDGVVPRIRSAVSSTLVLPAQVLEALPVAVLCAIGPCALPKVSTRGALAQVRAQVRAQLL